MPRLGGPGVAGRRCRDVRQDDGPVVVDALPAQPAQHVRGGFAGDLALHEVALGSDTSAGESDDVRGATVAVEVLHDGCGQIRRHDQSQAHHHRCIVAAGSGVGGEHIVWMSPCPADESSGVAPMRSRLAIPGGRAGSRMPTGWGGPRGARMVDRRWWAGSRPGGHPGALTHSPAGPPTHAAARRSRPCLGHAVQSRGHGAYARRFHPVAKDDDRIGGGLECWGCRRTPAGPESAWARSALS